MATVAVAAIDKPKRLFDALTGNDLSWSVKGAKPTGAWPGPDVATGAATLSDWNRQFHRKTAALYEKMMRSVLRTAIKKKHHTLILSALGSGAFRNSPATVAALWAKVLAEYECPPELSDPVKVSRRPRLR